MSDATQHHSGSGPAERSLDGPLGLVVALPGELGCLRERLRPAGRRQGLELLAGELVGVPLLAAVGGVGKVRAARAAALVLEAGARGLLSLGVCGGLSRRMPIGTLVHAERCVQADLAVREGREVLPDPAWLQAWSRAAPGVQGLFLTADSPAIRLHRRLRLARDFGAGSVAEMETSAIARVAADAELPWAACRAVSDTLGWGRSQRFEANYRTQAGRAAGTLATLFENWPPRAPA